MKIKKAPVTYVVEFSEEELRFIADFIGAQTIDALNNTIAEYAYDEEAAARLHSKVYDVLFDEFHFNG